MELKSPVVQLARQRAEREALRLIAYSSTVYPSIEGNLGDLLVEELIETGVAFAVSARRCLENTNGDPAISMRRWNYELRNDLRIETSLKRALNGIIHARQLRLHHARAPHQIFMESSNSIVLHYVYETDRYPETYVDIFGMAWAFISTPNGNAVRH
jgi:hypothetical protein